MRIVLIAGLNCLWSVVVLVASLTPLVGLGQSDQETIDLSGPIRITKLLWNANRQSSAQTLSATLGKALSREQHEELQKALRAIESKAATVVGTGDMTDPRFSPALATGLLLADDPRELEATVRKMLVGPANPADRALLLQTWFTTDRESAFEFFEFMIPKETDPANAAVLIQTAMAEDRAASAKILLADWSSMSQATRLSAIEPMTASAETMHLLVAAIRDGVCSKDLVNTNQLRKWSGSKNVELKQSIESVWGKIREADNLERQALVAETLKRLRSGVAGSASRGEVVFTRVCSQCHVLHGKGFEVGPNIIGNGRGSLEQLVSNIFDPSLVIGEAFQARTVLTVDGQVVSGLVAAEDEQYLKLKVQGGKIVEFDKLDDIELVKTSSKSLMPEGVEEQMTERELFDLIAYLCLLKPLGAPDNELIPGTPDGFVEP